MDVVFWSRIQFALTAGFHWLFVPLTIGLIVMIAVMETLYVWRGEEHWKRTAKFWMNIFAVNFAVGVATGLILEFEFGTNWSNYSWFVGDIFGAPLAIEGMLAFFMESVFIAVMFFGWNKVSKRFHLTATWLTALGTTFSALWILVANAWMQFPTGMKFNPDTVRHEMYDFWAVLFSPVAMNKFLHTTTSCYVLGAMVVIGISAWFLLKKKETQLAKNSMLIAAIVGLASSVVLITTGHGSAQHVAQKQPMKLAAMEGLYEGKYGASLVAIGVLNSNKDENNFVCKIELPKMLSWLSFGDVDSYVPGINNIIQGGYMIDEKGHPFIPFPDSLADNSPSTSYESCKKVLSVEERMQRGKIAINALTAYNHAKTLRDTAAMDSNRHVLESNFEHFGYGYFKSPTDAVPFVPLVFYSFHIMVILGVLFIAIFIAVLVLLYRKNIEKQRWLLRIALWSIPLAYISSMCGWIVAEVGRQPWVIQDLMPTMAAISQLSVGTVKLTFFIFATLFTLLLTIELRIMLKQIKKQAAEDTTE